MYLSPGTVTTYRPTEKQRRRDYDGKFDPASLMAFVSTASFPSVINISRGFTTNLLFRQPRKVAILVALPSFDNSSYASLATRRDARKAVVFTYMNRYKELSVRNPHPLRLLQKAQVDAVFGAQNTMILPDETLYQDIVTHSNTPPHPTVGGASGGCPFMAGGLGGAIHEEL
ncbi:hypothetical protein COOONC_10613 [Cooperia oncophora]